MHSSFASGSENTAATNGDTVTQDHDPDGQYLLDLCGHARPTARSFLTDEALEHAVTIFGANGDNDQFSRFKAAYRDTGLSGWKDLLAAIKRHRAELLQRCSAGLEDLGVDDDPQVGSGGYQVSETDPHHLADVILNEHCASSAHPGQTLLRYWNKTWWIYDGVTWENKDQETFANKIHYWLEREFINLAVAEAQRWAQTGADRSKQPRKWEVSIRLVAETIAAIRAKPEVSLPPELEQPAYIGASTPTFDPEAVITTKDGLVDFAELGRGKLQIHPHTPDLFSCHALNFNVILKPAFTESEQFLNSIKFTEGDPRRQLLKEQLGNLYSGSKTVQGITLWMGEPRAGKGTLAKISEAVMGHRYVYPFKVRNIASRFELNNYVGKRILIDHDCRFSTNPNDNNSIVEILLSLSSFDRISSDRKNTSAIDTTLPVKLLILTNMFPRFHDSVLATRFNPLIFTESFIGREDPGLLSRLLGELPGWIKFAAEGWEQLQKNNWRFTRVPSAIQMLKDLEYQAFPIKQWIDDCILIDPNYRETSQDLLRSWSQWCLQSGRDNRYNVQTLSPVLRTLHPTLKQGYIRDGNGKGAHRGIIGIKVLSEAERDARMLAAADAAERDQ